MWDLLRQLALEGSFSLQPEKTEVLSIESELTFSAFTIRRQDINQNIKTIHLSCVAQQMNAPSCECSGFSAMNRLVSAVVTPSTLFFDPSRYPGTSFSVMAPLACCHHEHVREGSVHQQASWAGCTWNVSLTGSSTVAILNICHTPSL